ncbi:hypothetical protein HMY34_14800 [Thiothrix subterranea]|uniref:oligosaccharide flippase family protein n=1 Tax=Thiothrix subterranea TaxID=2735563 RepID=UPI00192C1DF2|nr:oligosaccharide flippase family protein [Thiothrix subterranea]QQZ29926.1 hypothetical protein HMY34_14800 [Thiothrix subterranea]
MVFIKILRPHMILSISKISNIFLRFSSVGSKFVLIFFLAKELQPIEVGLFGLLSATITFSALLIGGDYYTYTQRELTLDNKEHNGKVLFNHIAAICIIYGITLPLHYLLFILDILPYSFLFMFYLILVSEHISQDIMRILIILKMPLIASLLLNIKTAVWITILVTSATLNNTNNLDLSSVFYYWLAGSFSSVVFGLLFINKSIAYTSFSLNNNSYLINGFKVASFFLLSTISLKIIFTLDRYILEAYYGLEVVAAYTLLFGIAMSLSTIIDAGVMSFKYPQMIFFFREKKFAEFLSIKRSLQKEIILWSLILSLLTYITTPYALALIEKPMYLEQTKNMLAPLLLMTFFYNIALVPHYQLYAQGKDKEILISNILLPIVFIVTSFLLIKVNISYSAIPTALAITMIANFLFKFSFSRKYKIS